MASQLSPRVSLIQSMTKVRAGYFAAKGTRGGGRCYQAGEGRYRARAGSRGVAWCTRALNISNAITPLVTVQCDGHSACGSVLAQARNRA
jgi:hypothetical protein